MADQRIMTCYKYTNRSLPNLETYMFVDTAFGQIQWQSEFGVTPWHGSWSTHGEQVAVMFDALHTEQRPAKLKSTILFKSSVPGTLTGQDYRGRLVELQPTYQWRFVPPPESSAEAGDTHGCWEPHAEWSAALGDWILSTPPDRAQS